MSSAVVSTSAALGRPFVFDDKAVPEVSSAYRRAHRGPSTAARAPSQACLAT